MIYSRGFDVEAGAIRANGASATISAIATHVSARYGYDGCSGMAQVVLVLWRRRAGTIATLGRPHKLLAFHLGHAARLGQVRQDDRGDDVRWSPIG